MIEINFNPSRRDLRIFCGLLIVFVAGVGAWLHWRHAQTALGTTVLAVGSVIAIAGLFVPAFARWVYVGWMVAVFPIGWVVSHLLLAIVFYLVFAPFGLVMRAFGRDPMTRKFDPDAESYWVPREGPAKPEQYFRQF
ncbi:MAG: SxtJ family membrane protein [Planctomycetaceae bacterium]